MSSFSTLRRFGLIVLALGATAGLAGCNGLTPAYNDTGSGAQNIQLRFDNPTNPLEQIVYQDLGKSFATSDDPQAPEVNVKVTAADRTLAQSVSGNSGAGFAGDPGTSQLVTASGVIHITQGTKNLLTASRQATATYTTDSQVLADNSAEQAAQEQAAHALADTLQLTIMSALTPNTPSGQ